jgi:HK97 family phage portal protein
MTRRSLLNGVLQRFGLEMIRKQTGTLSPVDQRGWYRIWESFAGAWQRNIAVNRDDVLAFSTVFACMTLIAGDIAKLWLNLVEEDEDQITTIVRNSPYGRVLQKPNHYQNRLQFFLYWVLAKLASGNTYALKQRNDARGLVTALYVLDAQRVKPLVAPDGAVYYQLHVDYLSGLDEQSDLVVPASEIIHDVMYPLFHPLVGLPPIFACGLASTQGLKIQNHSAKFFENNAMLSGILVAPGTISRETADKLEQHWAANYAGEMNAGKIAVLGDGLKFEPIPLVRAEEAQLIEQLKWTGENVCSCFHVPPYMVGLGPMPSYNNVQALNQQYYSQALQLLIEAIEICLNEGLELPATYATEFDLDALLRMDTATAIESATKAITGGLYKPNEGRAKLNLKPVDGGNTPYLQQQQWSLQALNRRDQQQAAPPSDPSLLPPAPGTESEQKALRLHLRTLLSRAA